ncbi:MAG: SUMF1/EgtB/PvdO family nonheme iron enzyme, partial [Nitrospinae bacterium]|nr:SUMF1/EgtB/PvdO family nonheme iron enzyme [Nitrospinota bacterium]
MVNRFLIPFLVQLFIWVPVIACNTKAYADGAAAGKNQGLPVRSPDEGYSGMAHVPAGSFRRGSTFKEVSRFYDFCRKVDKKCKRWWFKDEAPAYRVTLDEFWIDIYEVTNEKYLQFVLAAGHRPALDDACKTKKCGDGNLWKGTVVPDSIERQPVTQVNWFDAAAYCQWRGKRLPSEAEWEKAARGIDGNVYPWGFDLPPGKATYKRKWRGQFTMTDVGSYSSGASVYGIYDMAGNVWEWVADWYGYDYYKEKIKVNPKGPAKGKYKSVRGGSWVNY